VSENRTLPLPDPGPVAPGAQEHARAARRRLHVHQVQWVLLTASVALSAIPRVMPPALSPVLAVVGAVLAVRGGLRARAERTALLAARGPQPTTDLVATVTWRADPRGPVAEGFRRACNWWLLWVVGALAYLGLRMWLR
jgi:hypothetical protein